MRELLCGDLLYIRIGGFMMLPMGYNCIELKKMGGKGREEREKERDGGGRL